MDKENGETNEAATGPSGTSGGGSSAGGGGKVSNSNDNIGVGSAAGLLDAANLFGAYWPRTDAQSPANAASLFAAVAAGGAGAGAYGSAHPALGPHHSLPFGLLPPASSRAPSFPPAVSSSAYTNTLSVAASQAASLGLNPAASAAWWSMASQLAAQDYLARLQASGLSFPVGSPGDPYAALGLQGLGMHKSKKGSNGSSLGSKSSSKGRTSATALSLQAGAKLDGRLDPSKNSPYMQQRSSSSSHKLPSKTVGSGLTIQPTSKPSSIPSGVSQKKPSMSPSGKPSPDLKSTQVVAMPKSSTPKCTQPSGTNSSIFTSPLSLAAASTPETTPERSASTPGSGSSSNTVTTQSLVNSGIVSGLPPNILSDPSSILGGVRLPPDTEIIKYTSSIVGPKIPGTTNRGRKKTISLDPPSVSVMPTHSSTGILIERGNKWPKLQDPQDMSAVNDRVEVIKLPATNGSPGLNMSSGGSAGSSESGGDAPLNLSLKPASSSSTTNCHSNSLNSLSNLSANIGVDRISRRKPGPKPRRVIQSPSQLLGSGAIPGAPSASLAQLFAAADSPRPPSRSDDDLCSNTPVSTSTHSQNHKDGRPRNLGRGVSKPKKNTVASLLAQSRALGIKPVQIDPNTPMNQQMNLLKSNILAAQQYMAESGDERHLEKIRNALSDSSNMEVSTDSDNLTDSNQTDSEAETDANGLSNPKKRRHYNERELRVPLEKGWKRETVIRGLTKSGGIRGDVYYTPPNTNNKLKQWLEVAQYLEQAGNPSELTRDNFTFSCKLILGDYLQKPPPGVTAEGEYLRMTEDDVTKRLEELQSLTRSSLAVEQRIEVARRQQAARQAARLDREQARLVREMERNEKQEAARRDREARSQQMMEGRKRLAFTLEQKMQIINEIEGGKTKSDVSRQMGLASSTVATIWKNRENIVNAYGSNGGETPTTNDEPLVRLKECLPPENKPDVSSMMLAICTDTMAKRKRHEDLTRQRHEEQQRKIQEREMKKQQAAIIKEQMYIQEINKQREMLYTVELERERRRQHMSLVKALEARRRLEERERKKQQALLEKQASKERRMEQRRIDMEILTELRKPCEDLELTQKPLPEFERIPGLRLSGQAFSDIIMVFEFLHNFGETLGFDMESLPCLSSLQQALLNESIEAEEELLSVMTHLLVCAIEDPGIPNPARHTTILGQSLRQADITHSNISEILRIYLYANATGEVKALTGVHFERDREKRIADHHQSGLEMQLTQGGKNAAYYELLHENPTWRMSDSLKDRPFLALNPTEKAAMLAFLCNELLQNKAVIRQIEGSLENVAQMRKERWLLDTKIRKLRMTLNRKIRTEAAERAQAQAKLDSGENEVDNALVDSPALPHKDVDLLVDEEEEISENESEGTQPEEEEDKKLSGEELSKKLDKLMKTSETQLQSLNSSAQQLRATCYGQDRYWRRYWSLPTAGGVFVEAMESASPEVLEEQEKASENNALGINSVEDIKRIIHDTDTINDPNIDKEVSNIVEKMEVELNEHRKTPNREDTEIKSETGEEESDKKPKFSLFEKLGECMEKENNKEIKEEKLMKQETKLEDAVEEKPIIENHSSKWFSILTRDCATCEGVNLASGNKWDTGIICTRENYGAELKIPVFPPPNCQNNYLSCTSCDSPGPLQMTAEEQSQLEYIKANGPPQRCDKAIVPPEKRHGWWRITETEQLKEVLDSLHMRGCRERELKRTFHSTMQSMYESAARVHIEEGNKASIELTDPVPGEIMEGAMQVEIEHGVPVIDKYGSWNRAVGERVDFSVLEQVEALEDKVANASMQVKGWKIPNRECEDVSPGSAVSVAKERLAALEAAIERRYLKPPLGVRSVVMIENPSESHSQPSGVSQEPNPPSNGTPAPASSEATAPPVADTVPKGLTVWRDAVQRSNTSAQLAMCLYMLEASIAWDKSIMKANCQFCHSGDNEDKLLLCDSCDKGYHTYCFRPKLETIPEGNWYCHECINKVTGERNCIVCGKKQSTGRLMLCDLCPRAYHQDCINPPLTKVPRGKWYCPNCHSKQPKKRNSARRSYTKHTRDSESSDHPPASPAPSHSSVTNNEDTNQSTVSQTTPIKSQSFENSAHNTSQPLTNSGNQSTSSSPGGAANTAPRKERVSKKLQKELLPCKTLLEELECHDDSWPFLLPVNTKQFPTYKKIITNPMDLSTIKKRLQDLQYKSREEFCMDVRQIFDNCETFNEDDSPVGKAGHCMRQFFEARWNELCPPHASKS